MSGRRRWLRVLLALLLAGVLAFSALLGVVLWGSRSEVKPEGGYTAMIVLGCQVKPEGPSALLKDRLDTALDFWNGHSVEIIVVSGGQGPDEPVSEARCMYDYLTANGVPGERILLEDQSHNTVQNLRYTMALLNEAGYDTAGDMAVVSNGFHLARVRMLWSGPDNLYTVAAPSSHLPSRLKMYVREPLALVKSFLWDRYVLE